MCKMEHHSSIKGENKENIRDMDKFKNDRDDVVGVVGHTCSPGYSGG